MRLHISEEILVPLSVAMLELGLMLLVVGGIIIYGPPIVPLWYVQFDEAAQLASSLWLLVLPGLQILAILGNLAISQLPGDSTASAVQLVWWTSVFWLGVLTVSAIRIGSLVL